MLKMLHSYYREVIYTLVIRAEAVAEKVIWLEDQQPRTGEVGIW